MAAILFLKSFNTRSSVPSEPSLSGNPDLKREKLITSTTSNPDTEKRKHPNDSAADRSAFSPRAETEEALFREEGDTAQFQGYTVVKVGPENREDNPELIRLEQNWNQETSFYLENSLGLSPDQIRSYRQIKTKSFEAYDHKRTELLGEARNTYGRDIAIVLEGDLQKLYDNAWDKYDQALIRLMGHSRFDEFVRFRDRYQTEAAKQVGWAPDFVR